MTKKPYGYGYKFDVSVEKTPGPDFWDIVVGPPAGQEWPKGGLAVSVSMDTVQAIVNAAAEFGIKAEGGKAAPQEGERKVANYSGAWADRAVSIEGSGSKYIMVEGTGLRVPDAPLSLATVRAILRAADELGITKDEPLPGCIFCGGETIMGHDGARDDYRVVCTECDAHGPREFSPDEACTAYGERA